MKNLVCRYPFDSVAIKKFSREGHAQTFWPCCMMGNPTIAESKVGNIINHDFRLEHDPYIADLTPADIFNHPSMEKLRQNLAAGVRDPACKVCWEQEDRNIKSFREISMDGYKPEEVIANKKLRTIDMSLNNVCNLRCRMCTPTASNMLQIDQNYFEKNGLMPRLMNSVERWADSSNAGFKLKTNSQWQWIINNTDKFDVLRLSGGEPFYNYDVMEFIDTAIANGTSKDITLEFHTNGTLFDDELINKLKNFNCNLNISIDGTGKVYEYIRYPMTWDKLEESIRRYADVIQPKFHNFNFIVMINNVFNIPDYIAWIDTLPSSWFNVSFAEVHSQTRGVSLNNLSIDLLQQAYKEVEAAIEKHPNVPGYNALNIISDAINNNTENKEKCLEELVLFDMARNQHYRDFVDPRVSKWLES
jgi:molybdenum cofactor biosynthesis enzyme MoaA